MTHLSLEFLWVKRQWMRKPTHINTKRKRHYYEEREGIQVQIYNKTTHSGDQGNMPQVMSC